MRFFIVLEIPKENLAQFQSIQAKLHTLIPQAKLTDVDKVHLTLAFISGARKLVFKRSFQTSFIGEQPEELKGDLIKVITDAAENIPTFQVTPAYLDGFPGIHHPLVLWVEVKGDIDKIHIIRERIKDGLLSLHLPVDERRFVPHISIAKLNKPFTVHNGLETILQETMARQFNPIQISSIKLFESTPENGIHTHNTLAEIRLF